MTFPEQRVKDAQYIIHAQTTETIVYEGASIRAVVTAHPVPQEELEGGDSSGAITEFEIEITNNADADNFPGVAAPTWGQEVVVRGQTCYVNETEPEEINGTFHLMVRVVDEYNRGPTNEIFQS